MPPGSLLALPQTQHTMCPIGFALTVLWHVLMQALGQRMQALGSKIAAASAAKVGGATTVAEHCQL